MEGETFALYILNETDWAKKLEIVYYLKKKTGIFYDNTVIFKTLILKQFLNFLKENDIPRTIATMSEWDNVEFYIKEFHLKKWFDLDKIVYSDGKIPGKPAPDIFLIAAEKIGLPPSDCVVIEDALAGIKAAKSAGIGKIIAIASLEPVEFYQQIDGVSQIIKNFDEIDKCIFNLRTPSCNAVN